MELFFKESLKLELDKRDVFSVTLTVRPAF